MKNCYKPLEIKRVLLVCPLNRSNYFDLDTILENRPSLETPLGLAYISSYVKQHIEGLTVEVFDPNVAAVHHIRKTERSDMEELWQILENKMIEFQPDVVGVSCLFHWLHVSAHRACKIAKALPKPPVTVMGGNYPTALPNFALSDKNLDFVVSSEGEKSFARLITALMEGSDPAETTDGLSYDPSVFERLNITITEDFNPTKDRLNVIPKKVFTKGLEEFPWPDRGDLDMDFYATETRHFVNRFEDDDNVRLATMTGSRGCPFECTFCASKDFWGNQIRYRDPKSTVAEMKHLIETYDINTFVFNDDNLMFHPKNILELCNEIKRQNLDIRWFVGGGLQVSGLTRSDVVQAVIETGLRQFNLAIETGDPATMKKIKKPLKPGQTEAVIESLRKYDVWILGFFITGFHFQTIEEILKSHEYAGNLDLDWRGFYQFTPLPATEDYDTCVAKGYIQDYMILDGEYSEDMISLSTKNFSSDQILESNYRANLKYNFLENRNLHTKPQQALRDFNYILELYRDHAIGHYARGVALKNLGNAKEAIKAFQTARDLIKQSDTVESNRFSSNIQTLDTELHWGRYFEHFSIDLDREIKEFSATNSKLATSACGS